jgi:opacity protein-like surface antigen
MKNAFAAFAFAGLISTVSSPAAAAEAKRLELLAGYSFMHDTFDGGTNFPVGWTAGMNYNLTPGLGIVGEIGGSHKSESFSEAGVGASADLDVFTFMAGPKFTGRGNRRISPYFQALAGLARLSYGVSVDLFGFSESASDSVTEFAVQPGGGVDILLSDSIALRVGGDYRRIFAEEGANEFRLVTGVTFSFGEPVPAN